MRRFEYLNVGTERHDVSVDPLVFRESHSDIVSAVFIAGDAFFVIIVVDPVKVLGLKPEFKCDGFYGGGGFFIPKKKARSPLRCPPSRSSSAWR